MSLALNNWAQVLWLTLSGWNYSCLEQKKKKNSHGLKDVGAIEVRLYMVFYGFDVHQSLFALFF